MKEARPDAYVDCLDVLQFARPIFKKIYSGGYVSLLQRAPSLVASLYENFDQNRPGDSILDCVRLFLEESGLPEFEEFLQSRRYDLIINTHFLPTEIVAALKKREKISVPQVTVTTDFMTHKLWVHEPCEHYFTATAEGAEHLETFGVPKNKITPAGIPIRPGFHPNGLVKNDRPSILVIGGGLGLGPILDIYRKLLEIETPLTLQVVAGRNEQVKSDLEKFPVPPRHQSCIYGFTEKMPELMSHADIILTKPGGLSVSEALASGAVICVVNPFPGQEDFNAGFLIRNEAGISIKDTNLIPDEISALLNNKNKVEIMKKNSHNLSKPHAARTIAEKSLEFVAAHEKRN